MAQLLETLMGSCWGNVEVYAGFGWISLESASFINEKNLISWNKEVNGIIVLFHVCIIQLFLSHGYSNLNNLQRFLITKSKKFALWREELALANLLWNARGFKSLARRINAKVTLLIFPTLSFSFLTKKTKPISTRVINPIWGSRGVEWTS